MMVNPEDLGLASTKAQRDLVRVALGRRPVETRLVVSLAPTTEPEDDLGEWDDSITLPLLDALEEAARATAKIPSYSPRDPSYFSAADLTQEQDEFISLFSPDMTIKLIALARQALTTVERADTSPVKIRQPQPIDTSGRSDYPLLARMTDAAKALSRLLQSPAKAIITPVVDTAAARDVLAERIRQRDVETWSQENDDQYTNKQLAYAAGCYAAPIWLDREDRIKNAPPIGWPFGHEWWKPRTQRENLVRAGALILAEIERIDRALLRVESKPEEK